MTRIPDYGRSIRSLGLGVFVTMLLSVSLISATRRVRFRVTARVDFEMFCYPISKVFF